MENKRGRGRQPVPLSEKKIPITIWVKSKHGIKAKRECLKIQDKYNSSAA